MGTEAFLTWEGMTQADRAKQGYPGRFELTGHARGHAGTLFDGNGDNIILRLVPECYDPEAHEVAVPAALLRERLPAALESLERRFGDGQGGRDEMLRGFVERAEELEGAGLDPKVWVSY